SKDGRTQALGMVGNILTLNQAAGSIAASSAAAANNPDLKGGSGVGVSIAYGSSKSQSRERYQELQHTGADIQAGGNVRITATGAGKDSTIDITGSNISAANNVHLKADGDIRMSSAEDQASAQSSYSSQSASIGFRAQFNEHGAAIRAAANAAYAKGRGQGESTTHVNTQINAGNKVTIDSGGDVTLDGAQVRAKQVTGDIAGNLIITSPQDTASAKSRSESASIG